MMFQNEIYNFYIIFLGFTIILLLIIILYFVFETVRRRRRRVRLIWREVRKMEWKEREKGGWCVSFVEEEKRERTRGGI